MKKESKADIVRRLQEGLNAQQRSVPQLPAQAHAKKIKALGSKTDPKHPFSGYMVGADESADNNDQPLNELSPETLASYKKKAGAAASAADKAGDYEKGHKRFKGIVKATNKEFEKSAKKGVEENSNERNKQIESERKSYLENKLKEIDSQLKKLKDSGMTAPSLYNMPTITKIDQLEKDRREVVELLKYSFKKGVAEADKHSFIGKIQRGHELKKKVDATYPEIGIAQRAGDHAAASKAFRKHERYANLERPGTWTKVKDEGVAEGVTSPEIKQAYDAIMKTTPKTPERKRAIANYQKLRADAIAKKKQQGVAEGFPHDVDHMPGPVIRNADMTSDNVKTQDKAEWDRAVDSINAQVFDDMAEFRTDRNGESVTGNSAVWAKWDAATQTGWFNAKGRPLKPWPVKESGLAEGSKTSADIDKQIEFHKKGQAAAQYKGAMNKMHAKKIKDLVAKRDALKKDIKEAVANEDVLSALKTKLGDLLLQTLGKQAVDGDLKDKPNRRDDKEINPIIKKIKTDDGHEICIHGNEDDGFRISVKNKQAPSKFDTLDEAVMACEMYCAHRRDNLSNRDYVDEA